MARTPTPSKTIAALSTRWAFAELVDAWEMQADFESRVAAEFVDVWEMQADFAARVEAQFGKMIDDQLNQANRDASVNREKRV
ncbi:MAG: hypothetical protein KBO59_26805 [Achromobacter sp.]|nr:hypothetical protein [Achromobacter sp.]